MKGKRIIDPTLAGKNPKKIKLTSTQEVNKRYAYYCGEPFNAYQFPFISSQSLPRIKKCYNRIYYEPVIDNTGKPKYYQGYGAYTPKLGKSFQRISIFCPAKPFLEFSYRRYYDSQKGITPKLHRYNSAKQPFRKYQVFCPSKPFLGDQFRRFYENEEEKIKIDEDKINNIDLIK